MVNLELIQETLEGMVSYQKEAIQNGRITPITATTPSGIFAQFTRTESFKRLYSEAGRLFNAGFMPDINIEERLSGALFQNIVFLSMLNSKADNLNLLSRQNVFELYRLLHSEPGEPRIKTMSHPFGQDSLKGVLIPSMLTIKKDEETGRFLVRESFAVTLSANRHSIEKKHGALSKYRAMDPDLFTDGTDLVVVIPELSDAENNRRMVGRFVRAGADNVLQPLPIGDFNDYVQDVLKRYRPGGNGPTLKEIRNS